MAIFHQIIDELAQVFAIDITVESGNYVRLEVDDEQFVQIELDVSEEFILILSTISELPPGRFRENILKDALKANYFIDQHLSSLSYIDRKNELVLFEPVPIEGITGESLYERIDQLLIRSKKWTDAIESGNTLPNDEITMGESSGKKPPLFGFR